MRLLTAGDLVRRRTRPGERTTYFRIDDDAWEKLVRRRIAAMASLADIARDGAELVGPYSERAARLRAAREFFGWLAERLAEGVVTTRPRSLARAAEACMPAREIAMPRDLILALDQGTTSTRTIAFRAPQLAPAATARRDLPQHFPASGWVEHDAGGNLRPQPSKPCARRWPQAGGAAADVAAIGITNQRETTVVWDRATGRPIHKAIVWQDRRTAAACAALRADGHETLVTRTLGAAARPLFLRHQAGLAAGQRRRAPAPPPRPGGWPSAPSTPGCCGG